MADNLTISIGADSAGLRAQLAVAQSELRAFTREMNAAANAARRSGDEMSFAKVAQAAANVNTATGAVSKLKSEVNGLSEVRGAESLTESFRLLPGVVIRARESMVGLREAGEAAAAVFAVDKIIEWAREVSEAAERIKNFAAATGIATQTYAGLAGAMQLAGGDSETMARALVMLQQRAEQALREGHGKEYDAFKAIGLSPDDLKKSADQLVLLIADAFKRFQEAGRSTTPFADIFGPRQFANMVHLLDQGSAGIAALAAKWASYGNAVSKEGIDKLSELADKEHELDAAFRGLKDTIVESLQTPLERSLDLVTQMITGLRSAVEWAAKPSGIADIHGTVGRHVPSAAEEAAANAPSGHWERIGNRPVWRQGPAPGASSPALAPEGENVVAAAAAAATPAGATERAKSAAGGVSVPGPQMSAADAEIASMMRWTGEHLTRACAELVNQALAAAGLPTSGSNLASSFKNYGRPVEPGQVQRGDIFYAPPSGRGDTGHVGITLGGVENGRVQVVSSHMQGADSNPAGVEYRSAANLSFRRPGLPGSFGQGALPDYGAADKATLARFDEQIAAARERAQAGDRKALADFKALEDQKAAYQALSLADRDKYNAAHAPQQSAEQLKAATAAGREMTALNLQFYDRDTRNYVAALKDKEAAATDFPTKIALQKQIVEYEQQREAGRPVGPGTDNAVVSARRELTALQREAKQADFSSAFEAAEKAIARARRELSGFKSDMAALEAGGKITKQQEFGFDIQKAGQIGAESLAALGNVQPLAVTPIDKQRVEEALDQVKADNAATTKEIQRQWEEAGKVAAEAWAQPFKSALSSVGGSLETTLAALITKTETAAKAWRSFYQTAVKQAIDLGGSVLSKAAGGLLGGKPGEGIGDVLASKAGNWLSGQLGGLLGIGGSSGGGVTGAAGTALQVQANAQLTAHTALLSTIAANTGAQIATTAASGATSAAGSIAGGGISAGGSILGGGGIFGSIFSGLGSLFAFSGGGVVPAMSRGGIVLAASAGMIVPAAAGGWHLPGFGTDTQPAMLTPGEMVLPVGEKPSAIGERLAGMMNGQGGGAGITQPGGDMHFHFGAGGTFLDGPSFQRFFFQNGGKQMVADVLRGAWRKGTITSGPR